MNNFSKLFEIQRKMSQLMDMATGYTQFMGPLSRLIASEKKLQNPFKGLETSNAYKAVLEHQTIVHRFSPWLDKTHSVFDRLKKLSDAFRSNPEIEFISVSDLEILSATSTAELGDSLMEDFSDDFISGKEELLEEFLLPYLERLEVDYLWIGANHALKAVENPDRFRHAMTSLRTLLEFLIEHELASNLELSTSSSFKAEFSKFHRGKGQLDRVKVSRSKRIEYFTSKIQFGILDEFTQKDINFVCECYANLCRIHRPNLGLTETQVRILKIKTGITLWLLSHINEIIKNSKN